MFAKFVFNQEIRLLKLDESSFQSLQTTLPSVFKLPLPKPFSLFFMDETEDLISINSFDEVCYFAKAQKNPVRLMIKPADFVPEENGKTEKKEKNVSFEEIKEEKRAEDAVFEGVKCDGCGVKPITNVRYKCLSCDNYDLCSLCESTNTHSHHVFAKFKSPNQQLPKEQQETHEIKLPKEIFELAGPFLQKIKGEFQKKGKECCFWKRNENETKSEENEEEKKKKIEAFARQVTEIVGGSLEENIELVKGFGENAELSQILAVLTGQ